MLGDYLGIVCCESGKPFGAKLVPELERILEEEGMRNGNPMLIPSNTKKFASTELLTEIGSSVRGKHIIIVADCDNHAAGRSTDENFNELTQMIATARLVSAERISVLVPCQPYARQDKAKGRQPITAALKIREIENAGVPFLREMLFFDMHNKATAGNAVYTPIIPLYASKAIIPELQRMAMSGGLDLSNSEFWSADLGRITLAKYYAEQCRTGFGAIYKFRDYSKENCSEVRGFFGSPKGKDIILIDDMIDTFTSINNAIDTLCSEGVNSISVVHVHSLFNIKKTDEGIFDPVERCRQLYSEGVLKYVIGTDTVHNGRVDLAAEPWYRQVSVAGLAARVIYSVHTGHAISAYLE